MFLERKTLIPLCERKRNSFRLVIVADNPRECFTPKEIQQSEARPEEQTFDRDVRDTDQPQG
ncbi:hypothetical protein [Parabacteroides distasonis]|uniref:hypothetical protein n=1 Tax=Parabacteroides distasonis TaxID=823 RepID=UPI000E3995BA|nr:hypothetical protein [Parabacteroides distasonis]REC35220.1 hypothetical protein CF162_22885 [Parabacteroides distasonis]